MEAKQHTQEHPAVTKARNSGDTWVLFGMLAIISMLLGSIFAFALLLALIAEAAGDSENGIGNFAASFVGYSIFAVVTLVFAMIGIRMMRQVNLANALHIEYSDYAWLRVWSLGIAKELHMKPVEIFITQDPVINAYAFGFRRPYNIVLSSASIRYLTPDELKAVVLHEMGHIKYNHTLISTYLIVLRSIPLVGGIFGYLLDFWGRRTELTSDRLAANYLQDPELVKRSLIKVHVGPDAADALNHVARQWQAHNTNNWFNGFTQTFSSHPFLVRRLAHIDSMGLSGGPAAPVAAAPSQTSL